MGNLDFEAVIQKAVDDKLITGAILEAVYQTSNDSLDHYGNAFGKDSVGPNTASMDKNLFWVASCTKVSRKYQSCL